MNSSQGVFVIYYNYLSVMDIFSKWAVTPRRLMLQTWNRMGKKGWSCRNAESSVKEYKCNRPFLIFLLKGMISLYLTEWDFFKYKVKPSTGTLLWACAFLHSLDWKLKMSFSLAIESSFLLLFRTGLACYMLGELCSGRLKFHKFLGALMKTFLFINMPSFLLTPY